MSTKPTPDPTAASTTDSTPSTTPAAAQPPQPKGPSVLDKLMMIIETATTVAAAIPATSEYAQLALKVEGIATTAIQAHEQISGQPFDASLLKPIELIP